MPSVPRLVADLVLTGAAEVLTCVPAGGDPAGRRAGAVVAVSGERIAAVGARDTVEQQVDLSRARELDLSGKILAPGFVDPHTHLVFGGSRAREYAARLTHSLAEVQALGIPSGIQATVEVTQRSSQESLVESAALRLERMFRHGTTTVESKSGYGLSLESELAMLEVNRRLQGLQPVDLVSTFLGAHDFPRDMTRLAYLDLLTGEMIPRVAGEGLAEFCDVYCDVGYYTAAEARAVLEAAMFVGMRAKIHVDAYAGIGGSAVAAGLKVVSADHLNYTTRPEMRAYAAAGVTGVVMPGLDFAVRHPHPFDARAMLAEGMMVALATDLCPACWIESMQLVMQLACRLYALSPAEALFAATAAAARAVALDHDRGTLEPGKLADIQVWDIPSLDELIYRLGNNAVVAVVKRGQVYKF